MGVRMVEESQVLEMLKMFCNTEQRREQLDRIVGKLDQVNAEMEDIKASEGLYIKRITNDAKEEEMEKHASSQLRPLYLQGDDVSSHGKQENNLRAHQPQKQHTSQVEIKNILPINLFMCFQ